VAEEFDYEGEHLICAIPPDARVGPWMEHDPKPEVFEVQVKTIFQHAWSEPQQGFGYKPTRPLTQKQARKLHWVAASSWGADQQYEALWVELERDASSSQ
jgi:putative GTP pyrophosphokinase